MIKTRIIHLVALGALSSAVLASTRDVTEILGATHMNPLYRFTSAPVLEEGANVLRHMGSRAIKLWYGPDHAENYPWNHEWPEISNLTELAQSDYFATMFADPGFTTYSLEMATFDYRTAWKNGLVGYESNSISAEVEAFASHLLETYEGSGKTFILQNWEGDNNLDQNAEAVKVQGMIDWLNCWQDAITTAREKSSATNVWVYGAAECNKVGQPDWEGPRCVTDVFPHLRMDLYSYSDWYTRYEEDLLLEDLNVIKRHAPDSETFGHENVMLGEFGLNRTANGEEGNLLSSRAEFEVGVDVGARFAFYWCVYDTNTNKSHGLVLNAEHAGWFDLPVDHTGRYFTRTHDYFKTDALTLDVFEDLAADFGACDAFANVTIATNVVEEFDNDPSRFVRENANAPGELTYVFDRDARRFAIMAYEEPGRVSSLAVFASKTGEAGTYVEMPSRKVTNDVRPGESFRRILLKNVDRIPAGYRHFKVVFDGNVARSPQIASSRFYLLRRPSVATVQFGGLTSHLAHASHQALVGADELVQWNGVDGWGGSFGLNGTFFDGEAGAFLSSPSTGVRLTIEEIFSTHAAGTNTATSGGVLGVNGGDAAKFDASNEEALAFSFDRPVLLKHLILSALQYDGETAEVTIAGVSRSFTRLDPASTPAAWGDNRYVHTFDPPLELAAGTVARVGATKGQWGLEGVVVGVGALASSYDLWAEARGLEGADADWFADANGDGLNNQMNYATGGSAPRSELTADEEATVLRTVYQRRRDASARGLIYRVEWTDDLGSNVWRVSESAETGVAPIDEMFEVVTNQVPTDATSRFTRLTVELQE